MSKALEFFPGRRHGHQFLSERSAGSPKREVLQNCQRAANVYIGRLMNQQGRVRAGGAKMCSPQGCRTLNNIIRKCPQIEALPASIPSDEASQTAPTQLQRFYVEFELTVPRSEASRNTGNLDHNRRPFSGDREPLCASRTQSRRARPEIALNHSACIPARSDTVMIPRINNAPTNAPATAAKGD